MPAMEKEKATHSSVLAWRIPGTEEPGGLPSVGSHRVCIEMSDCLSIRKPFHSLNALFFIELLESTVLFNSSRWKNNSLIAKEVSSFSHSLCHLA